MKWNHPLTSYDTVRLQRSSPPIALALGPITAALRGGRRPVAAGSEHLNRAGERNRVGNKDERNERLGLYSAKVITPRSLQLSLTSNKSASFALYGYCWENQSNIEEVSTQ